MNDEMKGNILYEIGFEGQVSEREEQIEDISEVDEDCENCGVELTVKNKEYYNKEQSVGACKVCVNNGEASPGGLYSDLRCI